MLRKNVVIAGIAFICFGLALPFYAAAEKDGRSTVDIQGLGKKLQNPVAELISIPFQNNFEYDLGPDKDGSRYTLNLQPVIPISLNDNWNFILRPILPFIHQRNVIGNTAQEGLGDLELEPFFSPKAAGVDGIFWGAGPVLLFPTATNDNLGSRKYGIGPNGVVLKQIGPWTAGILANHMWSYAGDSKRGAISLTYLEPFFAYTTKKGFTVSCSSESTYDWKGAQWAIPLIGGVSQVLPFFDYFVNVGVSGMYYAKTPVGGAKWGIRAVLTLLLPENDL